jgi:hypothetical protein
VGPSHVPHGVGPSHVPHSVGAPSHSVPRGPR